MPERFTVVKILAVSAATSAAFRGFCFIRLGSAAAFTAIAAQQAVNNRGGATDAGLNAQGVHGAVFTASAALHAGVAVNDFHAFPIHFKYIVGTDIQAHAAAGAFLRVDRQGCHVLQINHASHFHYSPLRISDVTQTASPKIPAEISSGKAYRISFFTPERDVYVEAPVKFMNR